MITTPRMQDDIPVSLAIRLAKINLDLAKRITWLCPSEYRALIDERNDELNRVLDRVKR